MSEMPKRRWLTFRLRTLFVLVAVASVPMAWVGYSLNWIRERHAALAQHRLINELLNEQPMTAPAGLWLLGEKGKAEFYLVVGEAASAETTSAQRHLMRLFPESQFHLLLLDEKEEDVAY